MTASFERDFLGWEEPALPAAVRVLLEDLESTGPLVLSDRVIVTPGGRAGRRFRELLAERAEARGQPLRPPQMATIGTLPELLYRPSAPPPPSLRARLAWVAELTELSTSEMHLLLSRPPAGGDFMGWLAIARVIEGLHRELGAELLTFRDVASRCESGLLFDDGPRWEVLSAVQRRVLRRLRSSGWEDRETARRTALRKGNLVSPGEVWLVGVVELSRCAREMLSALEGTVRVLVHAPQEEADGFFPDGTLRTESWNGRALPIEEGDFEVVGAPVAQAERVMDYLAGLEGGYSPEEVTVGIPDAEVVPYLAQRLDLHRLPSRVAAGRSFPRIGPYLLLAAIARYLREGTPGALAELVRHPQLAPWLRAMGLDQDRTIRALDDFRERVLPKEAGPGAFPGRAGIPGRELSERLRRSMEDLLEPLRRPRRLREWTDPVVGLVEAIYGSRVLDDSRAEDREVEAFALALRGVLDEVEEGVPGPDPELSGASVLGLLLGEIEGAAVPPPAEDSAVEMLGWLELPLDDAPVLVLTGVNEGSLPESRIAHPFLPDGLRVALGIQGQRERRARDTYWMTAILRSRMRFLLVSGRRSAQGDPLRPSPLVLQGPSELAATRILRHYRQEGPVRPPGLRAAATSPPREAILTCPPEPELLPPDPPFKIRVTAFRELLQDPYRWLLTRKAGAAWVEDERRELDPMAFGTLAHRVLESLGTDLRAEGRADRLTRGLVERLDEVVRREFGTRLLPSVRVQIAQLRTRLEALAQVEARERNTGWEVVAVEAAVPDEGVPFPVDDDTVFLTGRVDRVDRHPELGVRLLDYKSSETAGDPDEQHRTRRERRWTDLQLPLYRHLAPYLRGLDLRESSVTSVAMGYFNVPRALGKIGIRMAEWVPDELESADEAARSALRPLLAGKPIRPDPDAPPLRDGDPLAPLMGIGLLREPGTEEAPDG